MSNVTPRPTPERLAEIRDWVQVLGETSTLPQTMHALRVVLAELDAVTRERDELQAALRGAEHCRDANGDRWNEALAERDKWRTAASVLCGAHVGVPQEACPVCALSAERERTRGLVEALEGIIERWDRCGSQHGRDGVPACPAMNEGIEALRALLPDAAQNDGPKQRWVLDLSPACGPGGGNG